MSRALAAAEAAAPARGLTLTESALLGMFFIQRYRFLTIDQYARAAGVKRATASDQLLELERHGLLGHFGNVGIRGRGKTPKVYFLKRKGYELLLRESDIPGDLIGTHKETHVDARWSPQMYHRLHTVDLMIAAETAVRERPHLSMARTFIEYRRVKRGTHIARETTDFVAAEETPENRIVPDAAFVLENIETGKRALFFVEMDMATERIVTTIRLCPKRTVCPKSRAAAQKRLFAGQRRSVRRIPAMRAVSAEHALLTALAAFRTQPAKGRDCCGTLHAPASPHPHAS